MSCGMQLGGIEVIAGVDNEISCKETYEANISGAEFIHADIFELEAKDLQNKLNLEKNDDHLVLIGCSPCQYWSIINTSKKKSEKSKNLLIEFQRFVKYFKPGFVVVENVPGVLKKKKESGLEDFISWLKQNNYKVHFKVHNVNDFNVPQSRTRFTLIASRVVQEEITPLKSAGPKLTVRDVLGLNNGFCPIPSGHRDRTDFFHSTSGLSNQNLERLRYVEKNGGNRLGFANIQHLQLKCFEGKDSAFKDSYGRMAWNKPSPTITTKFTSISNGRFSHPEEDRGISIREGACLQSFPKDFVFKTNSIGKAARIIGNAVPPEYAKRIALGITNKLK